MHARSMCFTAKPGSADELAGLLLRVADSLRSTPGCLSWIVARNPSAPDEVWVQKLWASLAAADAAPAAEETGEGPSPADVIALCDGMPRRTDLDPVGGMGFADG